MTTNTGRRSIWHRWRRICRGSVYKGGGVTPMGTMYERQMFRINGALSGPGYLASPDCNPMDPLVVGAQ